MYTVYIKLLLELSGQQRCHHVRRISQDSQSKPHSINERRELKYCEDEQLLTLKKI